MSVRTWLTAALLAVALPQALAQTLAQAPVVPTEAQARQYIFGAFITGAAHAIMSRDVTVDPELRRRAAIPPDADSRAIYDALIRITEYKPLTVRRARPDEVALVAPRAGRPLAEPL